METGEGALKTLFYEFLLQTSCDCFHLKFSHILACKEGYRSFFAKIVSGNSQVENERHIEYLSRKTLTKVHNHPQAEKTLKDVFRSCSIMIFSKK